jgi:hypothetical protein
LIRGSETKACTEHLARPVDGYGQKRKRPKCKMVRLRLHHCGRAKAQQGMVPFARLMHGWAAGGRGHCCSLLQYTASNRAAAGPLVCGVGEESDAFKMPARRSVIFCVSTTYYYYQRRAE